MTITKELCQQKIADLTAAKADLVAQANGCEGAIQTWQAIIELLDAPENNEPEAT